MMSAAMTPGTQPQRVSKNTINTDPHPRSTTASGGKIIANKTCRQDIVNLFSWLFPLQRYEKNPTHANFG